MITIGDLIKNKDYDFISYRVTPPKGVWEEDIFFGVCKSQNGELISLDGDTYDESEEVVRWEEWSTDKVSRGLTVVCEGDWL